MFAEKHFPEILYPNELDHYLERGWYRMGQSLFTTHFLFFDQSVYSAIWIRLHLPGYQFKKRARKLMNQITNKFTIKIRQGFICSEKESLFQKYKVEFDGQLAGSLKESLLDNEDYNLFDTYEVCIYDDEQLIAFSYFDLGATSAASIKGVYDPSYQKYSLGYFTMLMEIAFCQSRGIAYYYPGYFVPDYKRFDYKLRIGKVDYYDMVSQSWLSTWGDQQGRPPIQIKQDQLKILQKALSIQGIQASFLIYPFFEANLFSFWPAQYFDYPILLQIEEWQEKPEKLIVVFDLATNHYQLFSCVSIKELKGFFSQKFLDTLDPQVHLKEILIIQKTEASFTDTKAITALLKQKLFASTTSKTSHQ